MHIVESIGQSVASCEMATEGSVVHVDVFSARPVEYIADGTGRQYDRQDREPGI